MKVEKINDPEWHFEMSQDEAAEFAAWAFSAKTAARFWASLPQELQVAGRRRYQEMQG